MAKKILICEDNHLALGELELELTDKGHEIVSLLHPSSPESVISEIKETIEKELPDYVVIGSLGGHYCNAFEMARKATPQSVLMLYSSNENMVQQAKELSYIAFKKDEELERLVEFIRG